MQRIELSLSPRAQEAASQNGFTVGVRNAKDGEPAEIVLYGEIGAPWEATDARSVGQFLRDNRSRPVNVRINSPGGLAYDGITIHNALVSHDGKVTTIIEGMAGSAASIIAMAGNPVQIWENANLFIHRASVIAIGNEAVMEEAADWLRKIDESIARTYKAKTGKAMDKIMDWMRGKVDGTIFSAKEAVDNKFCDEIIKPKSAGASRNSVQNPAQALRADADSRLKNIEVLRAERIRSRRDVFNPAE